MYFYYRKLNSNLLSVKLTNCNTFLIIIEQKYNNNLKHEHCSHQFFGY